jgi:exodeoxyribonuclease V gamma subunit
LLRAWEEGMRRPLPLAVESAFEWLFASGGAPRDDARSEQDLAAAGKAARDKYNGGYSPGEVDRSASLRRAYPDFDALSASGEFASLAAMLLGPLIVAVKNNAGANE